MAQPRTFVEAPPVTPAPYGLLSTALVLDDLTGERAFGVAYEPAFCGAAYDANGVCQPDPDFGTLEASVDDARQVTLTADGIPSGDPAESYTIDWGDDTTAGPYDGSGVDNVTHSYGADGTYTILVTADSGYVGTVTVTVEDLEVSGPFTGDTGYARVDTEGAPAVVEGEPFGLYHLFSCNPVGMTADAFQDRARTALRLGEPRALERVTGYLLATSTESVDLTLSSGDGEHPVQALARLEKYAQANYGGVPVIHASPDLVAVWDHYGLVHRSGNGARLETLQGTLVTSGGGYDQLRGPLTDAGDDTTTQPAGTGEAWAYVTGQVVVRRSPVIEVGPVMDRAPAALNTRSALVERLSQVTWECVAAAILVDLYGGL